MQNNEQQAIAQKLAAKFDINDLQFRIDSDVREYNGKQMARVVVYIDSRTLQDRLDSVIGTFGWEFNWEPVGTKAAKGTLTILGISKSDIGTGDGKETEKGRVSDALKRCGVLFGIARYLYDAPDLFAEVDQRGKSWYIKQSELTRLRQKFA